MIKIVITPCEPINLFKQLSERRSAVESNPSHSFDLDERGAPQGGEKWKHRTINHNYIKLAPTLGGFVVALVHTADENEQWQLLNSFLGFLDRHFRGEINNIMISYGSLQE